jgi:hypothetical protein
MDLERENAYLRAEVNRVAHESQPAFLAIIAAFVVGVALAIASFFTSVGSTQGVFYGSLAQVIPTALLVLTFERRFLGDQLPIGPLARTMRRHGLSIFVRVVIVLPLIALGLTLTVLALADPPRWLLSVATVTACAALASLLTFIGAYAWYALRSPGPLPPAPEGLHGRVSPGRS